MLRCVCVSVSHEKACIIKLCCAEYPGKDLGVVVYLVFIQEALAVRWGPTSDGIPVHCRETCMQTFTPRGNVEFSIRTRMFLEDGRKLEKTHGANMQ